MEPGIEKNCKTVSSAVYPTYVAAKMNGGPVLRYPQALVKQTSKLPYTPSIDMTIEFNSDVDWFYPESTKTSRRMDIGAKTDFQCIFLNN